MDIHRGEPPGKRSIHSIEQDYVNPDLLFAGTEFGIFFSTDGGKVWTQLKSGIPTVAVRDIAFQKRENDLVIATFGRGFYILDNFSPLRDVNKTTLDKDAYIFPVKDALMFHKQAADTDRGQHISKLLILSLVPCLLTI